MRNALERGDTADAATLAAGVSKRGELRRRLQEAVEAERYGAAAELAAELQVSPCVKRHLCHEELPPCAR